MDSFYDDGKEEEPNENEWWGMYRGPTLQKAHPTGEFIVVV